MSILFDSFCAVIDPCSTGGYSDYVASRVAKEMREHEARERRKVYPTCSRIIGLDRTKGGRVVFNTGKVSIGIRYVIKAPSTDQGKSAEAIQSALLLVSNAHPKVAPVAKPALWAFEDWLRRWL